MCDVCSLKTRVLRGTSSTDAALLHFVLTGCDFAPVDKRLFLARSLWRLHSHFSSILLGDFCFSLRNFFGRHAYPRATWVAHQAPLMVVTCVH